LRHSIGATIVVRVRPEDRVFRDVAAFFREHQYCGELDGGVEDASG
jgi:hypothetical protein